MPLTLAWSAPAAAAPVISNVTVTDITSTSARVTWTLDMPGTGQVNYGTTDSYGSSTAAETGYLTFHAQAITGLTANTTYHFRVRSTNIDAQETVGTDATFTTLAATGTRPVVVNPLTYIPLVSATIPTYLGYHDDDMFGTRITRVTNANQRRQVYASIPAWNADETLLNMGFSLGGVDNRAMLRASDYTVLQNAQSGTATLFWSHIDPTKAWCQNGSNNGYRRLTVNTTTGAVTTAATYAASSISRPGGGTYTVFALGGVDGGIQGVQSDDDVYAAFMWKAGTSWGIGIQNLSTNTVHAERTIGTSSLVLSDLMDNCGMSHTGSWAWFTFKPDGSADNQGMWLYERDLNTTTRVHVNNSQEHCDWATTSGGLDRFIWWNGNVTSTNPSTGADTVLQANISGGTHISGRAKDHPGHVLVTPHETGYTTPGALTIFDVDIDNPGDARVWGHTHRTNNAGYAGEIHASPNWDMTKIVYAVNWEGAADVNAYVIEMQP